MPPANASVEKSTLRLIATVAVLDTTAIQIVFPASVSAMEQMEIIARP